MGHRDFANPVAASGVRWLLVSLVLAAVADLVTDVPSYFGTAFPVLGALSGTASYERYSPILIVVVPTMVGVIGFGGILRIERGRGSSRCCPPPPSCLRWSRFSAGSRSTFEFWADSPRSELEAGRSNDCRSGRSRTRTGFRFARKPPSR